MEPAFWLQRWDQAQIGFHQASVNPYLQQHWSDLQIPAKSPVFVPLCGKSLDMVWLRQQGHPVIGIEIAQIALRDFFRERGLQPQISGVGSMQCWQAEGYTLWCGDLFELTAEHLSGVRGVFDRAALIALPTDLRRRYVAKLRAILPVEARSLLVAVTYPQEQTAGPPFSVPESEVRRLYAGCEIQKLNDMEVLSLPENARFRERGMTHMSEQTYRIA